MNASAVRFQRRDDVRFEEIDGEAVIYDPAKRRTTYLNETATAIWKLCDGSLTGDEIASLFRQAFPELGGSITDDVQETMKAFQEAGLLAQ